MNYFNPDPKPEKKVKEPYKGLKRTPIKRKPVGNTDQVDVMRQVFEERGGKCEITGEPLGEFDPFMVHHLLNKNSYKLFKLYKDAMIVIHPDIHYAYHNNSKEYVISTFGVKANILYDRADELRIEYNKPKPTI
jgi:hypothetical protein